MATLDQNDICMVMKCKHAIACLRCNEVFCAKCMSHFAAHLIKKHDIIDLEVFNHTVK